MNTTTYTVKVGVAVAGMFRGELATVRVVGGVDGWRVERIRAGKGRDYVEYESKTAALADVQAAFDAANGVKTATPATKPTPAPENRTQDAAPKPAPRWTPVVGQVYRSRELYAVVRKVADGYTVAVWDTEANGEDCEADNTEHYTHFDGAAYVVRSLRNLLAADGRALEPVAPAPKVAKPRIRIPLVPVEKPTQEHTIVKGIGVLNAAPVNNVAVPLPAPTLPPSVPTAEKGPTNVGAPSAPVAQGKVEGWYYTVFTTSKVYATEEECKRAMKQAQKGKADRVYAIHSTLEQQGFTPENRDIAPVKPKLDPAKSLNGTPAPNKPAPIVPTKPTIIKQGRREDADDVYEVRSGKTVMGTIRYSQLASFVQANPGKSFYLWQEGSHKGSASYYPKTGALTITAAGHKTVKVMGYAN